jgi:hypothetical protein
MIDKLIDWADRATGYRFRSSGDDGKLRLVVIPVLLILLLLTLLGIYWSDEPDPFDIEEAAAELAPVTESRLTTGSYTTSALITAMETLLNKRGGYLSNDIMPPSIWLDNIPNWEFGVLVQSRDLARSIRNDFSRSQSQSAEDVDLIIAEPKFNFDNQSWFLPATESVYQEGITALYGYLERLQNPGDPNAQFYSRADNLQEWLGQVEKRLGSLSQRLSASVGQVRLNTDLAGDADAVQSTRTSSQVEVKTPWDEIDDVFYEARGASWALVQFKEECPDKPAPDHSRARGNPGSDVESDYPQRQRFRHFCQPLAGHGLVYLARKCRGNRSTQPASAGLVPSSRRLQVSAVMPAKADTSDRGIHFNPPRWFTESPRAFRSDFRPGPGIDSGSEAGMTKSRVRDDWVG